VAATRARDHLVLSLYHRASSRDSAAARLIERGAREAASEVVVPAVVVRERRASLPTVEAEDLVPLEGFEERREALVRDSRRQLLASATGLALERSDETEPWARGRGGTHVGRAVHAALQSLAWDAASDEIGAVARAQAVAEAIPERADEVARLVGKALGSSAAGRGREGRRTLREVPFALPLDGVLVEGFVDVVIESEDGLEIIDWKTDDVSAEHAAERLRQYELQAGLYAMGIEAATGRPVGKLTYVFIRPAVELSPGEPAVLIERARARLREGEGLE
jgi:ATP-dependent helicase/nuclease subunit A